MKMLSRRVSIFYFLLLSLFAGFILFGILFQADSNGQSLQWMLDRGVHIPDLSLMQWFFGMLPPVLAASVIFFVGYRTRHLMDTESPKLERRKSVGLGFAAAAIPPLCIGLFITIFLANSWGWGAFIGLIPLGLGAVLTLIAFALLIKR